MDKLNSTEKLLKVIRKKGDEPSEFSDSPSHSLPDAPPAGKGISPILSKLIHFQKHSAIGVDISNTALRLVKVTKHTDNKWKLLDFKSVQFPRQISKESPEFADFFKLELIKFCGPLVRKTPIWTAISAEGVEIHHIRIPMVAGKQLRDAVYMTVKREFPFDEEESIFDFEVQGKVVEGGVSKLSVMVYSAPVRSVGEMRKLFSNIGIPLAGVSIIPFAIQNILRTGYLPTDQETLAGLFIGNNFSRIDIFNRGNLVMTRGIKAGLNSVAESLMEAFNEKGYPSPDLPGEKISIGLEEARELIFTLNSNSDAITENNNIPGIKEDEIFAMILPALERLIRQVDVTFEHYAVNMRSPKVNKIYISTIMNGYKPLFDYLGEQLGMERKLFDPMSSEFSPLADGVNSPDMTDKSVFVSALGLALSDNAHTPNLIFTYQEKEKEASIARINWAVFLAFIAGVSLCSFWFLYQIHAVKQKEVAAVALERQLSEYNPQVDRNLILRTNNSVRQQWKKIEAYRHKHLALAVISEISGLTPANVRLLDLKISPEVSAGKSADLKKIEGDISVEGVVLGVPAELDAILAEYALKLENSPMFGGVSIKQNSLEPFKNGKLLHFIINLRLGSNHGTKG